MVTPVATDVAPARDASPTAAAPQRGWTVQLGAFAQETNAEALAGRAAALLSFVEPSEPTPIRVPRVEKDGSVYRVLVGASSDRGHAESLARQLEQLLDRPTTLLLR
jgi:cell division septation protein DedD